jgi:hypothetical protein
LKSFVRLHALYDSAGRPNHPLCQMGVGGVIFSTSFDNREYHARRITCDASFQS